MKTYIITLLYLIISIIFGYFYYKLDTRDGAIDNIGFLTLHTRNQIESVEFKKEKDSNKYYFVPQDIYVKHTKDSFWDYLLFSLSTTSTVGYKSILHNSIPVLILNIFHLIITLTIIPVVIYIFKKNARELRIFISIQVVSVIVFAILYMLGSLYDYKKKSKDKEYIFSFNDLLYTYLEKDNNILKLRTEDGVWRVRQKDSFFESFYFSLLTQAQVGYGTVWYPRTKLSKAINSIQHLFLIFLIIYFSFD